MGDLSPAELTANPNDAPVVLDYHKPLCWCQHCPSPEAAAAAAKSLQSCLTVCDPIDSSPPGSAIPGILQARTLELVAISFSNAWKWKLKEKSLSQVRLFVTPWTTRLLHPWDFPGKSTRVECHRLLLLQKLGVSYFLFILLTRMHLCVCTCPQLLNHIQLFCEPTDCSLPGFSVHEILHVWVLEWVAISYSRRSSQHGD